MPIYVFEGFKALAHRNSDITIASGPKIADEFEPSCDEGGVDGFNLA